MGLDEQWCSAKKLLPIVAGATAVGVIVAFLLPREARYTSLAEAPLAELCMELQRRIVV
eukprot:CAMPEP_0198428578 /NCGR_PEP_ID=MMETSP1452-20131203/6651_1 /TAXON_ID=1181717 /ORGANISM="Synchroma pusillum, Strain CCMP3072" /LENGTH=58 /DNA_ID=CAMNT_0044148975 /DNA_START=99 /DNA_END=275 /DNA_ORIENTATION=-